MITFKKQHDALARQLYMLVSRQRVRRETWQSDVAQPADWQALVSIARYPHKVAPALLDALNERRNTGAIVGSSSDLSSYVADLRIVLDHYQQELGAMASEQPVPSGSVVLLKGWAMRCWIGDGYSRQTNDIDLLVNDPLTFWSIARWLVERGYHIPALGVVYADAQNDRQPRCVLSLNKRLSGAQREAKVELHLGISPLSQYHFVDYGTIYEKAISHGGRSNDGFFLISSREDCLIVLLAELCEREPTVRDLLDLQQLLAHSSTMDWDYFMQRVRDEALLSQWRRLIRFRNMIDPSAQPIPDDASIGQGHMLQRAYWGIMDRSPRLNYVYPRILASSGIRQTIGAIARDIAQLIRELKAHRNGLSDVMKFDEFQHSTHFFAWLLHLDYEPAEAPVWSQGCCGNLFLRSPAGTFAAVAGSDFSSGQIECLRAECKALSGGFVSKPDDGLGANLR